MKLILIAIVLLFFIPEWVCAQQAEIPSAQQHENENKQKDTRNEQSESFLIRTINDPLSLYTCILAIFTAVLAIVSIVQGIFLFRAEKISRRMIEFTAKEFITNHRPRLRVRNIVVRPAYEGIFGIKTNSIIQGVARTLLGDGKHVTGQLYISNVGGSQAEITGVKVCVEWYQRVRNDLARSEYFDGLPMERCYEGINPDVVTITLKAGESTPMPFQSDEPMDKAGNIMYDKADNGHYWDMFVLGFVEYKDSSGIKRRTAFCRKYDCRRYCFVAVENPDYEHEE